MVKRAADRTAYGDAAVNDAPARMVSPHRGPGASAHYLAAVTADEAWHVELARQYGKAAGDARYDARGTATPELQRLHKAFRVANDAWLAFMRATRAA
jgi:hypothetical protein